MAGFEAIVRPVVFPDIRPTPQRSVRPQEDSTGDAEKGMCVIRGTSGKIVQISYSYSATATQSRPTETQRRVDEARVYQKNDDGSVNKENFIDIEVANKLWMEGGTRPSRRAKETSDMPVPEGYEQRFSPERNVWYLVPIKEKNNIEIRKRNKIKKAEDTE